MIQPTYAQQFIPQQYPQQFASQQPAQQPGGANAVAINIYNPQAYGSAPAQNPMGTVASYQQTPVYQMPVNSIYDSQTAAGYNPYSQYYIPQSYDMTQQYALPQYETQQQYALPTAQTPVAVSPNLVQQEQQTPVVDTPQMEPEVISVDETPVKQINVDELITNLKNDNPDTKGTAINEIATCAQDADPRVVQQVLTVPVFQAIVDEINKDTSNLEGPSDEQLKVAEKMDKGETLTPEEEALANNPSPRDAANINRILALYTLAILQRAQRNYQDEYIENQKANGEQPDSPLALADLAGIDDVVNVIKNDPRGEVRVGAIQALKHVVNPEDKELVEAIANETGILNSEDEGIKAAADELMAVFATPDTQAKAA